MKYGLYICAAAEAGDPRHMAELAAAAEDVGWDAIFLEDYIVYQGQRAIPTYDPWVTLAAMAVATRRVRLGTSVTPISRRRPWKLASEATTLDHLSQGRVVLGAGSGDLQDHGFERVGEPTSAATRAERLDEGLEIISRLWSGSPVSQEGTHFNVRDLQLCPRPVQQPRIPIWIGGDWLHPTVRRRLVRWDGCCVYKGPQSVEAPWQELTVADAAEIRAAVVVARGHVDDFEVCFGGRERGDDWEQERAHLATLQAAGVSWWNEWVKPGDRERVDASVKRGPLRVA